MPVARPRLPHTRASIRLASARAFSVRRVACGIGVLGGAAAVVINLAGHASPVPPGPEVQTVEAVPLPGVGPQYGITCPLGAVDIWPDTFIPSIVSLHSAGTTFCLRPGVHSLSSSITPKTGNTFVGEYGAILDGTEWMTSDNTEAAFRAHKEDIDDVTIRNLVIRNMPQRCIHAFYQFSDRWTIEHNEITGCRSGISVASESVVRRNYIHHNNGESEGGLIPNGAYIGTSIADTIFEENEISYNGGIQKVTLTTNVTFRNNYVHHNDGAGIWYDGDNIGALIEGNRVEDNGGSGIFYEISGRGVIRNNTVRRSGDHGVFISTSRDVEIYNNTLEDNFRGIQYFLNCASVGGGATTFDLADNTAYNNTIIVGTQSGAFANGLSYTSCTSAQAAPYLNGSKNLQFFRNTYHVPSVDGWYWYWERLLYWGQWQSIAQDVDGMVSQ